MVECTFELNGQPMSELKCGGHRFPAFSGLGSYVNKRATACIAGYGAIPPGAYYIIDRESGGILGSIRDMIKNRRDWFSLLAIDRKIDDEMICDKVTRGQFRLHPKGSLGISQGCIVIDDIHRFQDLRALLKATTQEKIKGTSVMTYGRVIVT
jgi:hypothetical protein